MITKSIIGILACIGVLVSGLLVGACNVGAWNLIFPSNHHEAVPPEVPEDLTQPAVLVFSKTNSFRHISGIKAGNAFFNTLAEEQGLGIFHTENSAVFNPEDLDGFSVVIFNNVTGDVLSNSQEMAFQQWLEAGGGWLGLHGAGDDSHSDWSWYVETLIGAAFIAHIMGPQFQEATVLVDDTSHVAMQTLPPRWEHNEEWYSWDESVRDKGFNVLLSVDEGTYNPHYKFLFSRKDLRMGDHPVVWNRCVGTGRSLYSAMGHRGDAYDSDEYQKLLNGAMKWLLDETACK
ncbi:MAG: ThuA domain-containing protein [Rhodothermaceae bacterium]|nr:ThuA domain-containing protein [Rhodothermaceae bacterium]